MQCRYREKLIYAGDMMWGVIYPTYRKAGARRGKFRTTTEVQQKLNEKRSRERLTYLVHANFNRNDYALHLTYENANLPETEGDVERDVKNYIRRLKRIYKRANAELKYIYVIEYSERGRAHVHMIVNKGADRDAVENAWGRGRCNADRLQFNECGVVDLTRYITKSARDGQHKYCTSKNLKQPIEKTNVHTWSKKQLTELDECAVGAQETLSKIYPGFWLSELPEIQKNGLNAGMYMTFTMFNPQGENLVWYRRTEEYKRRAAANY